MRTGHGHSFSDGCLGEASVFSPPPPHHVVCLSPFPCGLPVFTCLGLWSTMSSLLLPVGLASAMLSRRLSPAALWQSVALTHPCSHISAPLTALQVTLENCSAKSDTHCGCQSGWCVDCSTEPCGKSSPFSCVPCGATTPVHEAPTPREYSL